MRKRASAPDWIGASVVSDYDAANQMATLRSLNSDDSATAATTCAVSRAGHYLALTIPHATLSLDDAAAANFDFHWVDNAPVGGDTHDWWLLGDSAPNGRFNYRFQNRS